MSESWDKFHATLAGTNTGMRAVGPLVAADHAAQLSNVSVSQVVQSAKMLIEVLGMAHERYRGDFLIVFSDVAIEAEAMGCRLEFPLNAPPHVIKSVDPENLLSVIPHLDGRMPMMIEASSGLVEKYGKQIPVFASLKDPFSAAALACGAEDFFTLLVLNPQKAKYAVDIALENQQRYLEALIETGAQIVIGAPLATGSLLGSKHFREFAFEPICDLIEQAKDEGVIAGVHSCGNANPIVEDLVAIPADFLSLEEFDVDRWKQLAVQQRLPALMGFFPTGLLLTGQPDEIEFEVQREIGVMHGHAHIMATACDVPQTATPDQVQRFISAARVH
jgi:uroporphyrinogen decarboxylase